MFCPYIARLDLVFVKVLFSFRVALKDVGQIRQKIADPARSLAGSGYWIGCCLVLPAPGIELAASVEQHAICDFCH